MQAAKELSDQWNLTRIGEDLAVDVWMTDVSHYVFKMFSKGKGYEQCKFFGERFIILYLRKFGRLLGMDHSTLSFYWNFLFRLLQFNSKFYLNFLLLLLSYIIIPIGQLEYEIGVQFYYTHVQSNYF